MKANGLTPRVVDCRPHAEHTLDNDFNIETSVNALLMITEGMLACDDADGFARPMPAAVRRMLERHLDELEMAHRGLLYDARKPPVKILKGGVR